MKFSCIFWLLIFSCLSQSCKKQHLHNQVEEPKAPIIKSNFSSRVKLTENLNKAEYDVITIAHTFHNLSLDDLYDKFTYEHNVNLTKFSGDSYEYHYAYLMNAYLQLEFVKRSKNGAIDDFLKMNVSDKRTLTLGISSSPDESVGTFFQEILDKKYHYCPVNSN